MIIIYSLNETYIQNYYFLKALKNIENVSVGITVHDVVPFSNIGPNFIFKNQDQILSLGDFYIVHNNFSKNVLRNKFPMKKDYIFFHRFPLMDLKKYKYKINKRKKENIIRFLMLGVMRKEKGLEILFKAWEKIQNEYKNVELIIAGYIPYNPNYNYIELKKVKIYNKYLTDEEYIEFIMNSDYIVLPYTKGTNSGILSTVSSLLKPSITSDLKMFLESDFSIKNLIFKKGDSEDLYKVLKWVIDNHSKEYENLVRKLNDKVVKYERNFWKEVEYAYKKICNR
ncbi:glycosyltransferase [Marinitoga lauensis]|uniref:glycosyltransferase n=1 Tax=Marinitoga lauensis TaxID=2201189 RepID=UPI001010B122|nr:glycosyltransferase [Marinitoga lauensis]